MMLLRSSNINLVRRIVSNPYSYSLKTNGHIATTQVKSISSFIPTNDEIVDGITSLSTTFGTSNLVSIAAVSLAVRLCIIPFDVSLVQHSRRTYNARLRLANLKNKLNESPTPEERLAVASEVDDLMKSKKLKRFTMPFIWMLKCGVSVCILRSFLSILDPEVITIHSGNFLWISDFCAIDPTYILPSLVTAMLFVPILTSKDTKMLRLLFSKPTSPLVGIQLFKLVTPFIVLPIIMHMPALCSVYWLIGNSVSAALCLALKSNHLCDFLKVPVEKNYSKEEVLMIASAKDPVSQNEDLKEHIQVAQKASAVEQVLHLKRLEKQRQHGNKRL